jgi:predicted transposase YbfD/YdcC
LEANDGFQGKASNEEDGAMEEINELFGELEDPRSGNAKLHSLHEVLLIALCTVLCGGESCSDMALFGRSKRGFLSQSPELGNGVPSHDTFSRVFRLLDPECFHAWFIDYMKRFAEVCEGVVAIEGKTLRRSFDRASGRSPLHLVNAWAVEERLVLGQLAVDDKSNEIVAIPKLLELLSLKGRTVTLDAIGCQRKIAQDIIGQEADYVLALKGNQPALHDDVRHFLDDPETTLATAREIDKGHGRIEIREAGVSTDIDWLQDSHAWPGLQAIGKITASRESDGKTSSETRYYLLSRAETPERFNAIVRVHWGVENRLHWVLDVVFDEDQARNRKDHGPQNLALLRKLALVYHRPINNIIILNNLIQKVVLLGHSVSSNPYPRKLGPTHGKV